MKDDFCVRCGSNHIEVVEKELEFNFPNPGIVTVFQKCNECQECGEMYFDKKQIAELSHKLDEKKE
jgi:uncharacterized protein with PIN domain